MVEGASEYAGSNYRAIAQKGSRSTAFDRTRAHKEVVRTMKTLASRTRRSIDIPSNVREIKIRIGGTTYLVLIDGFAKRRIGSTNFIVDCRVERLNRLIRVVG